ncbi:MAG: hypothetical protein ACK40H_00520 [Sphingomonadaceae bacterium]
MPRGATARLLLIGLLAGSPGAPAGAQNFDRTAAGQTPVGAGPAQATATPALGRFTVRQGTEVRMTLEEALSSK